MRGIAIKPGSGGTASFVAPPVVARTLLTVVVEDEDLPGAAASWTIEILPPIVPVSGAGPRQ